MCFTTIFYIILDILWMWKQTNMRGIRQIVNCKYPILYFAYKYVILTENDIDLQKLAKGM